MQDDYTLPIARSDEQQFACILRNRSGISAGEIDMAARFIHELSDGDQQDAIEAAYSTYLKWCRETGKKSARDMPPKAVPISAKAALALFRKVQDWKPDTIGPFSMYGEEIARLINHVRGLAP